MSLLIEVADVNLSLLHSGNKQFFAQTTARIDGFIAITALSVSSPQRLSFSRAAKWGNFSHKIINSHLLEAEILAVVAEAATAHEQAVLANEAVRVRADAAANCEIINIFRMKSDEKVANEAKTDHERLPGPYLRGCEKKMFA